MQAWRELKRLDPDLFITDMRHPGGQIFDCLSERNITYPILIVSAGVGLNADGDWVYGEKRVCSLGRNLKISCLSKPYCVEDFRAAVETALQVPARRTP